MTIELTDKSYILGIWFSEMLNGDHTLTTIWKEDNGNWKGLTRYRARNNENDKIFGHKDKKTWYEIGIPNDKTEEELIKLMDGMQKKMSIISKFQDSLIVKGDANKLFELSRNKLWFNIKTEEIP